MPLLAADFETLLSLMTAPHNANMCGAIEMGSQSLI